MEKDSPHRKVTRARDESKTEVMATTAQGRMGYQEEEDWADEASAQV